jgi:hypothetical protein
MILIYKQSKKLIKLSCPPKKIKINTIEPNNISIFQLLHVFICTLENNPLMKPVNHVFAIFVASVYHNANVGQLVLCSYLVAYVNQNRIAKLVNAFVIVLRYSVFLEYVITAFLIMDFPKEIIARMTRYCGGCQNKLK